MTIHHATAKRAAKTGHVLTEVDERYKAHHVESNRAYYADTAKAALAIAEMFTDARAAGYVALRAEFSDTIEVYAHDELLGSFPANVVPEFNEILELADEFEVDLTLAASRGVVVPHSYRQKYKEEGHPDGCGDWLDELLKERTLTVEGLDLDAFDAILSENGVPLAGKWFEARFTQTRGWQGRYRMNGRQKLAAVVRETGVLMLSGTEVARRASGWTDETLGRGTVPRLNQGDQNPCLTT